MSIVNLFKRADGQWVTTADLVTALKSVGAHDCQVLYMHTGFRFGQPNPELKRVELLDAIYQSIRSLGVPTLCVPTFTFSFCNGQDYDVAKSKSHMGAINEYIRQRPEAIRSVDPLMSVAMVGEDRDLVENLGKVCVGTNSNFDKLSRKKGVKFLFLGVKLGDCGTYMHYLEWVEKVPYRYDRPFTGKIINGDKVYEDTYELFVRYNGVKAGTGSYVLEQNLIDRKEMRVAPLGDNFVSCVAEPDMSREYFDLIRKDPNFFILEPFSPQNTDKTFAAHNMVAM